MVEGEDCKFDDTNKSIIKLKVDETIQWIDNNRSASVDEIEEKQKELTELYMSCQQPDTESEAGLRRVQLSMRSIENIDIYKCQLPSS